MSNPAPVVFIDLHAVSQRVCLKKSAIYKMVRANAFPPPVRIGTKAVRWSAAEIDEWQRSRLAARAA